MTPSREKLHLAHSKRRKAEIQNGNISSVDGVTVLQKVRETLNQHSEDDCDAAWFAEIGRREQTLADGTAQTHSWDDVKRQAREKVNG